MNRIVPAVTCLVGALASLAHSDASASVARDAFRVSVAAVSVPGATRGFLVQHNTIFNGEWRIVVLPEPTSTDTVREPVAVYGEPDGVPIARWNERVSDVEWHASVVASPTPALDDSLIVASVEVRARNVGSVRRSVRLTFRLEQAEADRAFTAFVAASDDDSVGMDLINGWCGADVTGPDAAFEEELRPGGSASFRILMPSVSAPRRVLEAMARRYDCRAAARSEVWRGHHVAR